MNFNQTNKLMKRIVLLLICIVGLFVSVWIRNSHNDFREYDCNDTLEWTFLPNNTYIINVEYENKSDKDLEINLLSEKCMNSDGKVGSSIAELLCKKGENNVRMEFTVDSIVTHASISKPDDINIVRISLRNTQKYNDTVAIYIIVLFGIFCCICLLKKKIVGKEILIFALGSTVICSLPLMNDFLFYGHDLKFQLTRIEGLYFNLQNGNLLGRINPIQSFYYGNASATMYPQLFLYIPAALRLIGVSLLNSYKILLVLINLATVVVSYFSFEKMFDNKKIAIVGSAFYVFNLYRIDDMYIRGALGEVLALTFLPLLFWGMYEIFFGDKRRWPIATIGFSLVFQSHILSTEMYLFITIIVFIISLFGMNDRAGRILSVVKAGVATILVNLWFVVPFLQYYLEGFTITGDLAVYLPDRTVYFSQLFLNWIHEIGMGNIKLGSTNTEMPLSIGWMPFLVLLIFGIAYRKGNIDDKKGSTYTLGCFSLAFGWLLILMISWIIPWDIIPRNIIVDKLFRQVQFLWRYLGIIVFFFVISLCAFLKYLGEEFVSKFSLALVLIAVFLGIPALEITSQNNTFPGREYVAEINHTDENYYYPDGNVSKMLNRGEIVTASSKNINVSGYHKSCLQVEVDLDIQEQENEMYVDLPLYYYPGYVAYVNKAKESVKKGENNLVRVDVPCENQGTINLIVKFEEQPIWIIANVVSLVSIICFIAAFCIKRFGIFQWKK